MFVGQKWVFVNFNAFMQHEKKTFSISFNIMLIKFGFLNFMNRLVPKRREAKYKIHSRLSEQKNSFSSKDVEALKAIEQQHRKLANRVENHVRFISRINLRNEIKSETSGAFVQWLGEKKSPRRRCDHADVDFINEFEVD